MQRFLLSFFLSLLSLVVLAAASFADPRLPELRIGLVGFSGNERMEALRTSLNDYLEPVRDRLRLQLAFGSYAELEYWMRLGLVDVAVLTPGIAAHMKMRQPANSVLERWEYFTSVEDEGASHSVCLTSPGSQIKNISSLKALAAGNQLDFLFVDALSVSGYLAPLHALRKSGISVSPERIIWTHSHRNSLRLLDEQSSPERVRIACLWNQELPKDGPAPLVIPELGSLALPPALVFLRKGTPAEALRTLKMPYPFKPRDWQQDLKQIEALLGEASGSTAKRDPRRYSLEEFGNLLEHHTRDLPYPFRLAVVFSGGGAKCAFQVGAIRALEEKLAAMRKALNDPRFDIGLVVGTSGGAINALSVAMGAAASDSSFQAFSSLWKELDQKNIIRPSLAVRANMMLWFLCCQGFLLFLFDTWTGHRKIVLSFGILFGLLQIACVNLIPSAEVLFGDSAAWHRYWLWSCWGMEGAGPAIFLVSSIWLLNIWRKKEPPAEGFSRRRLLFVIAEVTGVLGLPLLQVYTVLFVEPTFSENSGIEETVVSKFPRLMEASLKEQGASALRVSKSRSRAESIRELSRQIIDRKLIRRDLVLTGSRLGIANTTLPGDLYFFLQAQAGEQPQFGERGLDLASHPDLLLDVMMGSGAIYPVFPARGLPGVLRGATELQIVDGSYSHRSPVEAAVHWGATHIVLFEASPEELLETGSFAANLAVSLNHLYDQAQLHDMHSKQQVVAFSVYPQAPQIGLLDFSPNFIRQAMDKGYQELRAESGTLPFVREPSAPRFLPLTGKSSL